MGIFDRFRKKREPKGRDQLRDISKRAARAHINLGSAYREKGWLDKAITEFRRAVELDPDDATAHGHLGAAYYSKGWFEQAIAEFKRAIELDPDDATAHFNLASAYYGSGRFDLAWKHARTAEKLGMSPRDVENLIGLLRKVSREPRDMYITVEESDRKGLATESKVEKRPAPPMAEDEDPFSEKVIAELEREDLTINWRYGYKLANRYEVKRVCSGGQAVVYIVEDLMEKGKRYAAKSLKAYFRKPKTEKEWKRREESINNYLQECNVWVGLGKHRHIVHAEYLDKIEGVPLVMSEFIDGGGLDDWLKKGPLDVATALDFAIQFCIGMEYANKKGVVVHRDIKPGNIMVTRDGVTKVNDFGIARAIESAEAIKPEAESEAALGSASLDVSRGIGTPTYMAPEQYPESLLAFKRYPIAPMGVEADIYAFGSVLYEMITGKCVVKLLPNWEVQQEVIEILSRPYINPGYRPRSWEQMVYCFLKTLKASPPRPSGNEHLNAVILKCLEKEPSERYHGFTDLREELMQIYREVTGREYHVVEEPPYEPNWRNMGRTYWVLGREKESFECYDKALEQNPADTLAWLEKGLASAEAGDLGEFGLCLEVVPYLKPSRGAIRQYKETILNEPNIRLRDLRLLDRIAFKHAVSERVRDRVSSEVEQELTEPFREPKPVVSKLLEELKDDDQDVRREAARALGGLGDRSAVPALIEALKDKDPRVKEAAAEALGGLGDRSAVPVLIEALKDEDDVVRSSVAEALGILGDASAVPTLIEALKDNRFTVRWMAARALGRLGDRSAVPALIEALKDEDLELQSYAAEALGILGDRSAVPALIEALKDEDFSVRVRAALAAESKGPTVRWMAARALGRLGDRSAVPVLIEALKDKDPRVKEAAAEALGGLGDRSAVPALIEESLVARKKAVEALRNVEWQGGNLPALMEDLTDKEPYIRLNAAMALRRLGDRSAVPARAVPALIEALKYGDKMVQDAVAEVIGKLADKQTIPRLLEALRSFPKPKYVIAALRWVCSQPGKAKLSHTRDELKAYSALELNKRGSELKARGEYREGLECFEKAIEIDPDWEAPKKARDDCLRNVDKVMDNLPLRYSTHSKDSP